jgi:prophage DNA circulation protein
MSRHNCAIGKDIVRASFKGVGFDCKDVGYEGGRRGAEGEFPFGERTAYADLGIKIKVFHLTGVFREDDHVLDSRALFRACESTGPGLLVHPTYGAVTVACRSAKVKDDLEESLGETTVELEFVEANTMGLAGLGGSLFGIISTGLSIASRDSFLRDYRPTLVAQPWRNDVIVRAQELVAAVSVVAIQTMPRSEATNQQWRDVLKVEEVSKDPGLVAIPEKVDRALSDGFTITAKNVVEPETELMIMRRLANKAGVTSKLPEGVAAESEEAVLSRHRVLAAIGMSQAAMATKYTHVDAALRAMDQVLAVLEDEAHAAYTQCDNTLFLELRKYATEFARMMNNLAYRLPGIIAVNFHAGVHPLVAAYAIYDDAKKHRELEQRNQVDANGRFQPIVVGVAPAQSVVVDHRYS